MKEYVYVVHTRPLPGREDDFNKWYSDQHLADVVALPGFVAAQRFRIADPADPKSPERIYLSTYTMRTDDPQAALEHMHQLVASGEMYVTDAVEVTDAVANLYEVITPVVTGN
ncbi:hypothetical protein VVT58_17665 (plasmid) [Sphingobium sp. SJ10-10]|uniref:hypothetical protein n=1 Tax=Sphingobium sp. SJ10-10 TaxID=3114999 RepID=UPI002E1992CD|nr:hypothetical protein [Sphingobium sp. SJ10-10]